DFLLKFADILKKKNDFAGALDQARRSYAIRQALERKDPTSPSRKRDLALAATAISDLLTLQKPDPDDPAKQNQNFDEAIQQCREAITVLDEFRPRYDRYVFDCYIRIGDVLKSRDDQDGALKEYKAASGIALGFATSNPTSVIWQRNLATSYRRVGEI